MQRDLQPAASQNRSVIKRNDISEKTANTSLSFFLQRSKEPLHSGYSLVGAVYGVYGSESDAWSDSNRLGTLTTDASGNTVTLELRAGTYWRRELTAPKGYALDTGVYSFSVTAGNTTTLSVSDNPQSDPVGVLLKKIDATSGDGEMR